MVCVGIDVAKDILMEYFREHEVVDAAVDGRMTILPSTVQAD